jgi:DNA-binding NarL/FixJ family response regulator
MNMGEILLTGSLNFEKSRIMNVSEKPIRLLIFEDNDDMRESLSVLFKGTSGIMFTGAYADATRVIEDVAATEPDVVLMDIDLPKVTGIEAVWLIKEKFPDVKVLMLTVFDDNDRVFQSICAGANGYILKRNPPAKIIESVFEVAAGGASLTSSIARKVLAMFPHFNASENETEALTQREREVLALLVKGHSYKMVASELNITIETVRSHIKKIYEKLHVHSSGEAISLALRNRLV